MPSSYSVNEKNIDINGDSLFDFSARLSHGVEYFGPHPYDTYYGNFMAMDSIVFLCRPYTIGPCNTAFDSAMYISDRFGGWETSQFMILNKMTLELINCCTVAQLKYVGFYLKKNNQKYFGWIRTIYDFNTSTLTILDCAINKTANDSIQAGAR